MIILYTLPHCDKCEIVKNWLKERKIKHTEKTITTEFQTELIMQNIFDDPPHLMVNDKILSSSEMFNSNGNLSTAALLGELNEKNAKS